MRAPWIQSRVDSTGREKLDSDRSSVASQAKLNSVFSWWNLGKLLALAFPSGTMTARMSPFWRLVLRSIERQATSSTHR